MPMLIQRSTQRVAVRVRQRQRVTVVVALPTLSEILIVVIVG